MGFKTVVLLNSPLFSLFLLCAGCVGEKTAPPADRESETSVDSNVSNQEPPEEQVSEQTEQQSAEEGAHSVELDEAIGGLLATLGDGETEDRIAASTALSEQVAAVMEQHSDWMKSGSVSQRRGIMLMMTGKAQAYPDATLNIVKLALDDTDSKVRGIGVQLIRQLLPAQAAQLHNRLLELINDRNEEPAIRNSILRLMALVPGDALATETALAELVLAESDDPTVKQAALQSYVKFAPVEPAIATLASVLESSDSHDVQRTTVVLLGKYGTKSKGTIGLIGDLMESDDEDLQEASAEALARIGSPSIDVLVQKLESNKLLTRQMAIFTLGVIGPSARDHVQKLETFITDDDLDTSTIAKEAIFNILKPRQ